jgi:hypothetical protein
MTPLFVVKPHLQIRTKSLGQFAVEAAKGTWGSEQMFSNERMKVLLQEKFGDGSFPEADRSELQATT